MIRYDSKENGVNEANPKRWHRFWEIDFLRGCAIILMLGFHWTVDCSMMTGQQPGFSTWLLSGWQVMTASLFLLLVGISLTLHRDSPEAPRRHYRRGTVILGWGLLITAVTRWFLPKEFVVFGILHLIGLALLISGPLLKLKNFNLVLGMLVIGLGIYLNRLRVPFPWLVWAGFIPEGFVSVDYFPFLPWYGVILVGIYVGKVFYGDRKSKLPGNHEPKIKIVQWVCFLGRNSLLIYLIHQPVLLLIAGFVGI